MRIFLFLVSLFLISPTEAGAKREPANASGSAKVVTFACRENANEPVLGLGIAYLRLDQKDENAASVGLSLYVQVKKNSFVSKTYQGSASAVPGGYAISVQGTSPFTLNLHPNEQTNLPGLVRTPVTCEPTASVASNL